MYAAEQDEPCAGGARRLLKLGRVHDRLARLGPARHWNDVVLTVCRQVALQGAYEIGGAPLMNRRLVGRLAGCVNIIEIEDRQCKGLLHRNIGLRALPTNRHC